MADIYEFRIKGHLSQLMRAALPELRARSQPAHTLRHGSATDPSASTRALAALTRHHITVTELRVDHRCGDHD